MASSYNDRRKYIFVTFSYIFSTTSKKKDLDNVYLESICNGFYKQNDKRIAHFRDWTENNLHLILKTNVVVIFNL